MQRIVRWIVLLELPPRGVPYQQVEIEFVTKKGYGKNVPQRDPATLNTIEAAKKITSAGS